MDTLRNRLEELTGTFLDSWTSLGNLHQGIVPDCNIDTPSNGVIWVTNDSTTMQVTSGNNVLSDAVVLHSAPIEEVRRRNSAEGDNLRNLGNMLVVTLYQEWDEVHRHRIAKSRDVAARDLKVPVFGDLRKYRNDIIHNKGVSSASHETKVLAPIAEGDAIFINIDHWFAIRRAIEDWIDAP